jgi:mono/diheme cytochrome c family protein
MKKIILSTFTVILAIAISSCFRNPKKPGYVYMPDMHHSVAVETYDKTLNKTIFKDGLSALTPPKGTIPYAQGAIYNKSEYKPYRHTFSTEGEAAAKADVNPIEKNEANLAEGKRLYEIYCAPCHGATGEANGTVTTANNRAFPMGAGFSYFTDANMALTDGQMFYITQYGRNLMQSYATQLNVKERWQVIAYVKQMQANYKAENATVALAPSK